MQCYTPPLPAPVTSSATPLSLQARRLLAAGQIDQEVDIDNSCATKKHKVCYGPVCYGARRAVSAALAPSQPHLHDIAIQERHTPLATKRTFDRQLDKVDE